MTPTTFTRQQLESIRDSSKAGKLPHAFLGLRMITFSSLAEQLLATMDENERLRESLENRSTIGL